MTSNDFITTQIPKFYAIRWVIPPTYFTDAFVLKTEWFTDRESMEYFRFHYKKFWWEYLPFVRRMFFHSLERL